MIYKVKCIFFFFIKCLDLNEYISEYISMSSNYPSYIKNGA